jgi:hypothetical protein
MDWWFGRKAALADARPFAPAWLSCAAVEDGFARSHEGLVARVKSSGETATFSGGAWVIGTVTGSKFAVGGQQVIGAQGAAIAGPSGGTTVDAAARTAIGEASRRFGCMA